MKNIHFTHSDIIFSFTEEICVKVKNFYKINIKYKYKYNINNI